MKTVDEVGVEFGVIDNATDSLNRIAASSDQLANKTSRMQSAFAKRVDATGAMLMSRAMNELMGGVKGADIAFMLLGRQINVFMAKMGPIGIAIALATIAFVAIKNAMEGGAAKMKEAADKANALSDALVGLSKSTKGLSEDNRSYLVTAAKLQEIQLKQLSNMEWELAKKREVKDYMLLFAKGTIDAIGLQLLENKGVQDYITLQKQRAEAEKKLKEIQDLLAGKTDITTGKSYEDRLREMAIADDKKAQQEKISNLSKYWAQDREITKSQLAEKMDEEDKALYEAQSKYKAYYDAINNAQLSSAEREKALATYQALVSKQLAENQKKTWADKNKFMIDQMAMTYDYLGSLAEKWAYGEKMTIESITSNYVIAWIDAIEQVVRAKMIEALATPATWGLAAAYGAALVGLGALKGGLRRAGDTSLGTYPQEPTYTQDFGTQYGANYISPTSGEPSAATAGGVSSSHSQVTNYFTISPRYELLDISLLSEMRLKEIASQIGKYIQEGVATGQVGLS